jgi:hypothetical protein
MKKLAYGIGIGLALGAAISLIVLYLGDQSASAVKTALAISIKATNTDDVAIDGWVDDQRVRPGQTVTFWIAVHYPPATPPLATPPPAKPLRISDVRILAMRYPNFGIPPAEKGCWTNAVLQCGEPSGPKLPDPARILPQGGTLTFEGHLVAGPDLGRFGIAAVVGWKDAAGVEHRKPISIAPITVARDWFQPTLRILKAAQSLIIPLVTFFFGVWFSSYNAKRDLGLKKAQENAARLQQTWNLMLPKLHANAEKYYMRLSSHATRIVQYTEEGKPDYAFFFYLKFFAQMKRLIDDIGGFYLKSMEGEAILSDTWSLIMDEADSPTWFGRSDRERLQLAMPEKYTFSEFAPSLKYGLVARAYSRFLADQSAFARQMILFKLFADIFDFEMNVGYLYWYGKGPELDQDAFKRQVDGLEEMKLGPKYEKLIVSLRSYLEEAVVRASEMQEQTAALDVL